MHGAILNQIHALGYAVSVHRLNGTVEMHAVLLREPEGGEVDDQARAEVYPKEPAEMLAFRYDAHLQAIAEIEEVVTVPCRSELSRFVPEVDGEACRLAYDCGERVPHYVYKLKGIVLPRRIIPAGRVFQAVKVKAFLSALQSCDSISDAVAQTRDLSGR